MWIQGYYMDKLMTAQFVDVSYSILIYQCTCIMHNFCVEYNCVIVNILNSLKMTTIYRKCHYNNTFEVIGASEWTVSLLFSLNCL